MSSESTNGGAFDSHGNNGMADTNTGLLDRLAQMMAQNASQSQSNTGNIVVQEAAVRRFVDSLRTEQRQLLLQFLEELLLQLPVTEQTQREEHPHQQEEPQTPEPNFLVSFFIEYAQQAFHSTSTNVEHYPGTEGTLSSIEDSFNNTPRPATFTFNNRLQSQQQEQHLYPEIRLMTSAERVAASTSTPPSSSILPRSSLRDDERSRSEDNRESFPRKLYRIIKDAEEEGNDDIISFIPSGLAFRVHKPKKFQNRIIPRYFGHNRYSSFRRLLGMYCFRLLQSGPEAGCFCHEYFRRGSPDSCDRIVRREG